MDSREALLSAKEVVERFGDSRAVHSYNLEFGRRFKVLKLIEEIPQAEFNCLRSRCTAFHNFLHP
jgi:ABC-type taurine transport system ATPase subunit